MAIFFFFKERICSQMTELILPCFSLKWEVNRSYGRLEAHF